MDFIIRQTLIPSVLEKIRNAALEAGLQPSAALQVEVAMGEVLENILKHGYQGRPGKVHLEIEIDRGEALKIAIRDQAPPFNLASAPADYDRSLPLEERPIGGLGVPIVKAFFDELEWEPYEGGNCLKLTRLVV